VEAHKTEEQRLTAELEAAKEAAKAAEVGAGVTVEIGSGRPAGRLQLATALQHHLDVTFAPNNGFHSRFVIPPHIFTSLLTTGPGSGGPAGQGDRAAGGSHTAHPGDRDQAG